MRASVSHTGPLADASLGWQVRGGAEEQVRLDDFRGRLVHPPLLVVAEDEERTATKSALCE